MAGPVVAAQLEAEIPSTASARLEEPDFSSSNWYFSREEIEKYSPSRKDGIDLKKETYYRRSYCTYLQDLGMRLKVPQVTIATAIVFCHRFFLRQSHARNDRQMIATVCMFLAGKVEETPRHLDEVIKVSYIIRFKKDPNASEKIKIKEVFLKQRELMLLGEKLVLTTLGFDLNIYHPYKPLVAAIKKFKVSQNTLAQVAWNFVNDGLRTSLCLQFKPHHIAAGAIFLAAKFLKIKLSDGDKSWWQEFEVTPRQLEVVSNQMLELYEQNRPPPGSRSSDPSASAPPPRATANGSDAQVSPPAESNDVVKPDKDDSKKTSAVSEEMVLSPSVNGLQADVKKSAQEHPEAPVHATATEDGDVEMKVEEPAAVPGATDAVDEQEMEVNKDKLKAAVEKRRKARVEGSDVKPRQEATDEELLERELENGVEAAVEVERSSKSEDPPEKQAKLENGYRRDDRGRSEEPRREEPPRRDERGKSEDSRRDDRDGKRPKKEEESASKRKRDENASYSKDDRVAVEEGELPPAGAHDRSPRRGLSPHDRRRESYGRDHAARRDTLFDSKQYSSSSSYRYHNRDHGGGGGGGSSGGSYHHHSSAHHHYSQQQQQQQPEQQHHGDWHRAPREAWSDRESKKPRYDHGK